jgi:acetyl esterase
MAGINISDDIQAIAHARTTLLGGRLYRQIGVTEARRFFTILKPGGGRPIQRIEAQTVIGRSGHEIPIRVYQDTDAPQGVFIWIHGGGWTLGDLETSDGLCREFASAVGCKVISVAPRLAPEFPFPTPLEDVLDVVAWTFVEQNRLQPGQAVAIGGDSSGGNLATAACIAVRDSVEMEQVLRAQVLIYPVVDFRTDYPSMVADADPLLAVADTIWFAGNYVPDLLDRENQYAAPNWAPNLKGLPPAIVIVGEADPLGDGVRSYAERLRREGVPVELRTYTNVGHAFFGVPKSAVGMRSLSDVAGDLKNALTGGDL